MVAGVKKTVEGGPEFLSLNLSQRLAGSLLKFFSASDIYHLAYTFIQQPNNSTKNLWLEVRMLTDINQIIQSKCCL